MRCCCKTPLYSFEPTLGYARFVLGSLSQIVSNLEPITLPSLYVEFWGPESTVLSTCGLSKLSALEQLTFEGGAANQLLSRWDLSQLLSGLLNLYLIQLKVDTGLMYIGALGKLTELVVRDVHLCQDYNEHGQALLGHNRLLQLMWLNCMEKLVIDVFSFDNQDQAGAQIAEAMFRSRNVSASIKVDC